MTLLDDHSRFALLLHACANKQQSTVEALLTAAFRRYGLPQAILADNSAPWSTAGAGSGITALEAWLLRLGVEPRHGRPQHPQTQGKVERFHGTIAAEVFATETPFADLAQAQRAFVALRACSNHHRPHEAPGHHAPQTRYQPSPRAFPQALLEIVYGPEDTVTTVIVHGSMQWEGRRHFVSRGLVGQPGAVRPTQHGGLWAVYSCQRQVAATPCSRIDYLLIADQGERAHRRHRSVSHSRCYPCLPSLPPLPSSLPSITFTRDLEAPQCGGRFTRNFGK